MTNSQRLYIGRRFTGIIVKPDAKYPNMFRVHGPNSDISDMVNLTRVKDAALSLYRNDQLLNSFRHSWKASQ